MALLLKTDLWCTNLADATLSEAQLVFAELNNTRVGGADFTRTIISYANFRDVDLSDVIGLEAVSHGGPSTIGLDTIYRSKGQIPESFLRGAGVPENFITHSAARRAWPMAHT
jgi:hypothetical protein